jgi:two-component system, OmpR family, phosphate regulon sensor histidine kinase PhoR
MAKQGWMSTSLDHATAATYEQAFARAPIGMALVGLDSRFLEVNAALCAIAGRTRDELVDAPFGTVTHPDDVDEDLAQASELVRGERDLFAREKRYVRPDGSVRWVEAGGTLIRDDYGNPLHFVFHIQDITERRAALHALSGSEDRFRSAFDDALTGMVLVGPDGRVRRINEVACQVLGRESRRLLGVLVAEFTHPGDAVQDAERMRSILNGDSDGGRWEKRYVHSSGRTVWADVSTVLVRDADGEPRHFITQIADITERVQAERVKDEFLATISHELRTPLTSIQGYTDLLTEDADLSAGVRRNAVSVIQRNAERLRRLVDDVQFIAQARAETLSMRSGPVQLDRVVAECVEWAGPRAGELGLQLTVHTDPIELADGDSGRLVQAVDHLVANALAYTERGGRVAVRLTRDGDSAVIEVADTGVGLDEADRARLFERFFRASSAVDAAVPGVGLGLSIVQAIVDLHGGRVTVASAPGQGATFTVLLPVAR